MVLLPCREEDLNRTESSFIKELVPPYNLDQRGQPYGRSRNSDLIVLVRLAGAQRRKFIAAARKKGVGMSRFAREILMWYVGHLVGEDDGKFWIF